MGPARYLRYLRYLLATLPVAALLVIAGPSGPGDDDNKRLAATIVLDRYIVMLRPNTDPAAVAAAHGLRPTSVYTHAIRGFAATIPSLVASQLEQRADVISLTPVRPVEAFAQEVPTGVRRIGADLVLDGTDQRVDAEIAIIDTGIKQGRADLNVIAHVDCMGETATCVPGGDDGHGHGTHVAGTAAALDDRSEVVGVAPGARLHGVKVLNDNGSGTTETVIRGLDYVAANASSIDVANMSLGGACVRAVFLVPCDDEPCDVTTDAEHKAVCNVVEAGVTIAVAAGNSQRDAQHYAPAAYDEVITVSAHADFDGEPGGLGQDVYQFSSCTEDEDDSFACFSNFGDDVDLTAPGVGILSLTLGGIGRASGTSMASPHVAGAAALYKSHNPAASPAEVRAALIAAAEPTPCVRTTSSGACADDPDSVRDPLVFVGGACEVDGDCSDDDACTADSCAVDGTCSYEHTSCDDDDACTVDDCDPVSGDCTHAALSCDDGDACTVDSCDSVSGCQAEPASCGVSDGCCVDGCGDPDCPSATCGDGICAGDGEDCHSCPSDCRCAGKQCSSACCGDGICAKENSKSCPVDCGG